MLVEHNLISAVAPFAGAGIEIALTPSAGMITTVAHFAGEGIEMPVRRGARRRRAVAPFAGVMKYNQIVHATLVQQVALFAEGET